MDTKYSYVKSEIKSKILQGNILPHQKIGSETDLMKEYSVSRHTVRKAIGDLVVEGWIYKKQGAGTFCADRSAAVQQQERRTKNIAVITTYFSDYIFPAIIRGAQSYLSENGYQVTVFSTNNDHEQERRCLEDVLAQQFDGLIVEPTKSSQPNPNINYYLNIERLGIPYVMIHAYYEELEPIHIVMDDEEGGRQQTAHLIEQGHRHILGFFKNDDIQGKLRTKGFIKAHREAGLTLSPQNIINYTTETMREVPRQVLRNRLSGNGERPTAIVCYNDQLAVGLLDVLREKELSVPEDISIVGFDNSFLSIASEVKLTTIVHPQEEMGIQAANTLHQIIKNKESPIGEAKIRSITYKPTLKVRNSTRSIEVSPAVK
ncbi:GntR family transcriptional regulator [Evansella sp. LMS18]|uniref:GntR family transcriptional regulator n=1 Tax=Evansella sp. LMS18 TaxID=2924033 RepID=UPI0020D02A85|nr:GntR family transcriptional regulator [Evansella sp. LMS18]UTR12020.1 GntR family transcriptional regulator [Evansella sp. LMS18]